MDIITIVYILVTYLALCSDRTVSLDDVPEFQYPCYVDICTFPSQFCNSRERRCSPCTRQLCRLSETSVPLACRYTCIKNNQISTTPSTTTIEVWTSTTNSGIDSLKSLHLIMAYSAVTTTVFLIILLSFIAYYVHRKLVKREQKKQSDRNHNNIEHIEETHTDSIEPQICRTCSQPVQRMYGRSTHRNISSSYPPSYRTTENTVEMSTIAISTTDVYNSSASSSPSQTPTHPLQKVNNVPINATVDVDKKQHYNPWQSSVSAGIQTGQLNSIEPYTPEVTTQTPLLTRTANDIASGNDRSIPSSTSSSGDDTSLKCG